MSAVEGHAAVSVTITNSPGQVARLARRPVPQKAASSTPSQGTYRRQPIDVSFSHRYFSLALSPFLSFKSQ